MTTPTAETAAAPGTESTPPATSGRARRLLLPLVEPATVVVASSLMFLLGFGGLRAFLSVPQGGGDLLPPYVSGHFWAMGTPFGNAHWGFPIGMDERYYPTADVLQNAFAGLWGALAHNPFFGINVVWALSFPVTALAAWWVMRLTGLRSPMAVFFSLALTFVPYHWLRIAHIYLGTMYSAVLGVGLAMLVASGWVERAFRAPRAHRWALLGVAGIAAVVGLSGIYYVCFTAILGAVALGYRVVRGASWRGLLLSATPIVTAVGFLALALAPAVLYTHQNPALDPVAARQPIESVIYSGMLSQALLPSTHSWIPFGPLGHLVTVANTTAAAVGDAGVLWDADSGSLFTSLGVAFLVVGGLVLARRRHLGRPAPVDDHATPVSLGFLATMLVTSLLFFIPWGLNFLFALTVTPQIRGWDRLIPVLFTIEFALVATMWRQLGLWTRGVKAVVLAAVLSVVILFDTVLPFRSFFQANSAAGAVERAAGLAYAESLNAAIPEHCGVLQLPYISYPEAGPREGLSDYSHFMPGLTNPDKDWSFGAMVGTVESDWQKQLGNDIDTADIDHLADVGFCAIHVDRRGFTPEEYDALSTQLTGLLGAPVATGHGGDWTAYAIPAAEVNGEGFDPAELSPDDREFLYPSEAGPTP